MVDLENDVTPVVITLVHGTFARGASWTREGSLFRNRLQEQLGPNARFEVLEWSGWNFNISRLRGAKLLADHILHVGSKGHRQVIIGHSHGGNVIRYALREQDVVNHVAGVITLGTPFLYSTPRRFESWFSFNIKCLGVMAAVLSFGLAGVLVVGFFVEIRGFGVRVPGFLALFPFLVASFLIASVLRLIWVIPLDWIVQRLVFRLKAKQESGLQSLATPSITGLPLLVCRTFADEASIALDVARFSTEWLFDILADRILTGAVFFVALPIALIAGVSLLLPFIPFTEPVTQAAALGLVGLISIPTGMLTYAVCLLSLPYLTRFVGFGVEMAFEAWLLDFQAFSKPMDWEPQEIRDVVLPRWSWRDDRRLRHSVIYQDIDTVNYCAGWISRMLKGMFKSSVTGDEAPAQPYHPASAPQVLREKDPAKSDVGFDPRVQSGLVAGLVAFIMEAIFLTGSASAHGALLIRLTYAGVIAALVGLAFGMMYHILSRNSFVCIISVITFAVCVNIPILLIAKYQETMLAVVLFVTFWVITPGTLAGILLLWDHWRDR